jgi:hypothetical protein
MVVVGLLDEFGFFELVGLAWSSRLFEGWCGVC